MEDNVEILGMRVIDDKVTTEYGFFKPKEIFFIDVFQPKSNYFVPRFHTKKGEFTVFLTLESCKVTFKHLTKLDSGNLVDIDQITYVTESPFAITAYFPTGTKTANVSRVKRKYIEHLIKKT
ncbi:dipeptidyl aminopeptidase [Paenibacillus alvei]|uniref:Dipeptidyl aminopeptidase n=1 Tax=Paenibacillus alvei TaxID=44250 RepID=A0ABT4H0Z9_PAEAL|nr:hypothetical protein [Paenibacillus alvei]EJW14472.1 hypothetical protein PAV_13c00910 [Paenibacillus alvei DSM 29]MCY9542222.1 dipeptidyl aminopeptidase [Paenibacillus alvei]MCY9706125.1 dipeptidyl aminopeptidase [Paenibacillus alvei]MCY9734810.1 dipeptidyl aminopeptidase [Paenibacillus alvei]MCY9758589.1 dipeptidyl aminopeptidase [Paenibacillus alvei]